SPEQPHHPRSAPLSRRRRTTPRPSRHAGRRHPRSPERGTDDESDGGRTRGPRPGRSRRPRRAAPSGSRPTVARLRLATPTGLARGGPRMGLARVIGLLERRIGLDPASLGPSAFAAAVRDRMRALALTDPVAYAGRLTDSPEEFDALVDRLVVPETWFFRGG